MMTLSSTGRMSTSWLIILLSLIPLMGWGQKTYAPEEIENVQLKDYRQFVSDPEGRFSADDRARLNAALYELREKHTVEAVLVAVPAVVEDDPEGFSLRLFRLWGLGKKEDNNGLLILYGYGEGGRFVRFEVGYGLEGVLSDITTARISRNIIIPSIKRGDEVGAFIAAIEGMDRLLTDGYEARNSGNSIPTQSGESEWDLMNSIVWYLILSLIIGAIMSVTLYVRYKGEKDPARRARSIMSPGGLSLLFLTTFFPAGIVYGLLRSRLVRKIKDEGSTCPQCRTPNAVRLLTYPQNVQYLTQRDLVEAKLRSVTHYTMACSNCSYHKGFSVVKQATDLQVCPHCGGHTLQYTTRQRISAGRQRLIYTCAYCGHEKSKTITTQSVSTGGFGGGGFGGGGFGGGFGGGSSGGGGSTTRF